MPSKAWSSFRSYYRVSYASSALAILVRHSPQRLHHSHASTAFGDTWMISIPKNEERKPSGRSWPDRRSGPGRRITVEKFRRQLREQLQHLVPRLPTLAEASPKGTPGDCYSNDALPVSCCLSRRNLLISTQPPSSERIRKSTSH